MTETFENIKLLFQRIQYEKYNWNICVDLKVTALLLEMWLGYQTIVLFCVSEIARTDNIITSKNSCLIENRLLQKIKSIIRNINKLGKIYLSPINIKVGLLKL